MTEDAVFAKEKIVPLGDAIVTYYAEHWPRDPNGKIRMTPEQSLETYQLDAVNPTPDIAGLKHVLARLLGLPQSVTAPAQRAAWKKTLDDLPSIPTGKTAKGKIPPLGQGHADGTMIILPAEKYGRTRNSENPESYVAFPYQLYGVGTPSWVWLETPSRPGFSHKTPVGGRTGTAASAFPGSGGPATIIFPTSTTVVRA